MFVYDIFMSTNLPKVHLAIAHFGKGSFCLKYALKSAEKYTHNVSLIGDSSNRAVWHRHYDVKTLNPSRYELFCSTYVHRSSNSKIFEMACFKRFFFLYEWMKQNGFERAVLLDSDIVTCSNLGDEISSIVGENCCAAFMRPTEQGDMQWTASPHVSFWTMKGLREFTEFCLDANQRKDLIEKLDEKWRWHIDNNELGGVCDMTYLYLWGILRADIKSLCPVRDGKAIDFSINVPHNDYKNEYQMFCGVKSIWFQGDIPFGFNILQKQKIRFLALHCQARNKLITAFLYYPFLRRAYWVTKPVYLAIRFIIRNVRKIFGRKLND